MDADTVCPYSHDEFRIAIVCALPIESTAVIAMFDKRWHASALYRLPNDINEYTVGRISLHNVVLAHLPSMGTNSAAASVNNLYATFNNIELVLAVGLCGGVPTTGSEPMILGDVVVSTSIVQYDFGRQHPHAFVQKSVGQGDFPRRGPRMLSFMHRMETLQATGELLQTTQQYLEGMLQQPEFITWRRPHPDTNRSFNPGYRHKHWQTGICDVCDACQGPVDETCQESLKASCSVLGCDIEHSVLQRRATRPVSPSVVFQPSVHFGTVASGNQVMRSALHRDTIAKQANAIAFEMEGAGLSDYGPTLLIKGVCDYADSHKNKDWQKYACAVAASCMKALLDEWSGNATTVLETTHDRRRTEQIIPKPWLRKILDRFDGIEEAQFDSFRWIFHRNANPLFRYTTGDDLQLAQRDDGSSLSALSLYTKRFQRAPSSSWDPCGLKAWLKDQNGIFWITGKPGCGKSTLMKLIYKDDQYKQMLDQWASGSTLLTPSFFSWRAGSELQKTQHGLLLSVLYQSLKSYPPLAHHILDQMEQNDFSHMNTAGNDSPQVLWSLQRVKSIFTKLLRLKSFRICILIDGLDEMDWSYLDLADYLMELTRNNTLKILASSRHTPEFSAVFHNCQKLQLHEWTSHDIELYVRGRFYGNPFLRQQAEEHSREFSRLIEEVLLKAEGVFLWVKTAVTSLIKGIYRADTFTDLRKRLTKLPTELVDLYETILYSVDQDYEADARRLFSLLLAAGNQQKQGPVVTLAAHYDQTKPDWIISQASMDAQAFQKLMNQVRKRIEGVCSQFISISENTTRQTWSVDFIHRSVYDFFRSPKAQRWLSKESADPDFHIVAIRIGEFTWRYWRSLNQYVLDRCVYWMDVLSLELHDSGSSRYTTSTILVLRQLETAYFQLAAGDIQAVWDGFVYLRARDNVCLVDATVNEYYLSRYWSRNHSNWNLVVLGLMLLGRLASTAQLLLRSNHYKLTREDLVDVLTLATFRHHYFAPLELVADFYAKDPHSVHLFWQRLILNFSCYANFLSDHCVAHKFEYFTHSIYHVVKQLMQLGVDPNVFVQCSPTELQRPVLQTPLRVFRRCVAASKNVRGGFYESAIRGHYLTHINRYDSETLPDIIELLLQYGAKDLEETPSFGVNQPEESILMDTWMSPRVSVLARGIRSHGTYCEVVYWTFPRR